MWRKLWRWLKQCYESIRGRFRKPAPPPPPPPPPPDIEFETKFMALLEAVAKGASSAEIQVQTMATDIKEGEWIPWLQRFGERLQENPPQHQEIAQRMVRFGELYRKELGKVAVRIGKQVLAQIPPPEKDEAGIWKQRGKQQLERGDFAGAITSCNEAIRLKPDYAEAYLNRGVAQFYLGQYEEAIASYNQAIRLKADFSNGYNNRGLALFKLGQYEEAITSLNEAIRLNPNNADAYIHRGLALFELGQYEEAITSLNDGLRFNPNNAESYVCRGLALGELGKYEEAITSLNEAIRLNPNIPQAYRNRGGAQALLGQYEEAIASFDSALILERDYWTAYYTRGIAAGMLLTRNSPYLPSDLAIQNPDLNLRGFEGELASYREGLKYCQQDTHPEGWGMLNFYIADAYYLRSKQYPTHRHEDYPKAFTHYNLALETLTETAYPENHLEVVQSLYRLCARRGDTENADKWGLHGLKVLQTLLNRSTSSKRKQQLAEEFWLLRELAVDVLVQKGLCENALEAAERDKNLYLTWILDAYQERVFSPSWQEMQQLLQLNPIAGGATPPQTAIVYWHISADSLTTFLLKPGVPQPILICGSAEGLHQLEDWVEEWRKDYRHHREKGKNSETSNSKDWFERMPKRLKGLQNILDIPAIESQLDGITDLILIPHRQLHVLPLEALFQGYRMRRLPSIQVGRNLLATPTPDTPSLLSIEHPDSEGTEPLPFAEIECAAICQLFPHCTRLWPQQATHDTVKTALAKGTGIFHFTGHAAHHETQPKKSALYLSGTDTLTLAEISQFNLETYHLIALAACETGITSNEFKIEYVGLVSAFVSRRAANVVSTLWTVPDKASSYFTIYFYWQLSKGKSPTVALAKAKTWLQQLTEAKLERLLTAIFAKLPAEETTLRPFVRNELNRIAKIELSQKSRKPFEHPYYWAGFTLTGL